VSPVETRAVASLNPADMLLICWLRLVSFC